MEIKDLKAGDKAVNIVVQVNAISETREFERLGQKNRMATAVVEDKTGSVDMPLFNEELDKVKVGDIVKITNGYVGEFNGIKQLRAGKFGKLDVLDVKSPAGKKQPVILKEKKIEKKIKIKTPVKEKESVENWCKKCGKIQDPVLLGDYDGMCIDCWKGNKDEEEDYE